MEGWLMDAWRSGERIACWIKTRDGETVERYPQTMTVYAKPYPKLLRWLDLQGISYAPAIKHTYDSIERVVAIRAPVRGFERFVDQLERAGSYCTPLFDADISPEERFLAERNLTGGCYASFDNHTIAPAQGPELPALRIARYSFAFSGQLRVDPGRVLTVSGDLETKGDEREVLEAIARDVITRDPDVLIIEDAFAALPVIDERMRAHGIEPAFHRFENAPIRSRGGMSFFRYGTVVWRDYSLRLRGRLLFDKRADVAGTCDVEGMVELSRLSGVPLQKAGARSPGNVFQGAIVRDLIQSGRIVSHKSKPLPEPMSMSDLVLTDRAGLSFDPLIGFHRNVVELDFSAMFPTIMATRNISAEKIGTGSFAPGVPVRVDQEGESIVSRCMKPFVELRAQYKHGNERERKRAAALKGVLVSANGYLRFREFKLGIATSHVALCAWAREHLFEAKELAEDDGYRLVHGIVDSIYVQGDTSEERIESLRKRITKRTGITMEHEGTFRWIVLLASKNDPGRPVITRFFGAHTDGSVKLRGIEARQKSTPKLIARVQEAMIRSVAHLDTEEQIRIALEAMIPELSRILEQLDAFPRADLACTINLSKKQYRTNSLQRRVLASWHRAGLRTEPGQRIRYVHTQRGPEPLTGSSPIDADAYRDLLVRAARTVTEPFGITHLNERLSAPAQRTLAHYDQRKNPISRKSNLLSEVAVQYTEHVHFLVEDQQ